MPWFPGSHLHFGKMRCRATQLWKKLCLGMALAPPLKAPSATAAAEQPFRSDSGFLKLCPLVSHFVESGIRIRGFALHLLPLKGS